MFFQFRHRISGSGSFLKIIFLVSPYFADFFCICHSPSVWQSSLMFLCLQRSFTLENYDLFFRMFLPIPTGVRVKSGRISKKVSPTHALQFYFKVSPQKIKISNNFFETFLKCSLQCLFRKNAIKKIGHRGRSRAKDHRTSLSGTWIEKQYRVLRMRARSFPWLRTWLLSTIQDARCKTDK